MLDKTIATHVWLFVPGGIWQAGAGLTDENDFK